MAVKKKMHLGTPNKREKKSTILVLVLLEREREGGRNHENILYR